MPVTWEQHGQLEYFKKSWSSKFYWNIYGKRFWSDLTSQHISGNQSLERLDFQSDCQAGGGSEEEKDEGLHDLTERDTLKHQRESPPLFLYNKQNHLNCSVRTARKSQSPTGGQVRRSWFYIARQLLEQQIRTGDRSGQGLGPSLSGPTSSLQHLVSPVPFSL